MFTFTHHITTLLGVLSLAPIGHGGVLFQMNGLTVYVDPYTETTDFTGFPKADLIIFSHDHYDHYDVKALELLATPKTQYVGPVCMAAHLSLAQELNNGDSWTWNGIGITAVPAYNIVNKRPDGQPFHPKGYGNGYLFTFGDLTVYVAGDTELIPEMDSLPAIDIAFLPKNLPYTMSDEMFVEAVARVKAPVVYPVHYFEIDKEALAKAVGPQVTLRYE